RDRGRRCATHRRESGTRVRFPGRPRAAERSARTGRTTGPAGLRPSGRTAEPAVRTGAETRLRVHAGRGHGSDGRAGLEPHLQPRTRTEPEARLEPDPRTGTEACPRPRTRFRPRTRACPEPAASLEPGFRTGTAACLPPRTHAGPAPGLQAR